MYEEETCGCGEKYLTREHRVECYKCEEKRLWFNKKKKQTTLEKFI